MEAKANSARQAYKVETLSGEELHKLDPHADTKYLVINLGQSPDVNETIKIAISAAMTAILASMNQRTPAKNGVRARAASAKDKEPVEQARAERNAQRREALNAQIFADSSWLQAKELSEKAGFTSANPSAGPNRWKQAGKIFAVQHNGKDYFPDYLLDEGYRPLPIVKKIISLFGDKKTAWGLAIWFGFANSWLGGEKPKDLLTTQPERVLAAAQAEMEGGIHG